MFSLGKISNPIMPMVKIILSQIFSLHFCTLANYIKTILRKIQVLILLFHLTYKLNMNPLHGGKVLCICIPEIFNTNISHQIYDYKITFVNSQLERTKIPKMNLY